MTYALRFLPEVETDARNGRTWYEDLTRNPRMYPQAHRDFHRR